MLSRAKTKYLECKFVDVTHEADVELRIDTQVILADVELRIDTQVPWVNNPRNGW